MLPKNFWKNHSFGGWHTLRAEASWVSFSESHRKEKKVAEVVSGAPSAEANVHVTGRRILATVVDAIVLGLVFAVMSMLFGSSSAQGAQVSASLEGFSALVYFVLVFAYYILMEGYLGQTVGKMVVGIKVVREGTGEAPGLGGAAVRTVLRIIDGLFFYLVAFIAVLASGKNQRLGDMVAHTLVVKK
jgi:uncharacterized RDD family membrane protein YckC